MSRSKNTQKLVELRRLDYVCTCGAVRRADRRNCRIHGFDASSAGLALAVEFRDRRLGRRLWFVPFGLGRSAQSDAKVRNAADRHRVRQTLRSAAGIDDFYELPALTAPHRHSARWDVW